MIKVVIRDEAHRSLWDKTEEAIEQMHSFDEVDKNILQEQDKDLLETDVMFSDEKIELLFTATPNLLDKSVRDTYGEIFWLKLQDLVEEEVLHMPKFIQTSEAHIHIWDANIWERILNEFATKFVNENWVFSYIEITNKYLELKKEHNWYMPAVWFCRDIEHAEFMRKYLNEKWIRAIRVTSANKDYDAWIDESEAKKMIEANEVDVVLTVTKVSEWWDVPTLRCALNYAPILSEAKYIQWIWRVLRNFDYEENREENEKNWVLPKGFAYIIEPKFWNISNNSSVNWWDSDWWNSDWWWNDDDTDITNSTKISGITHLIYSKEFDINYLRDLYGNLDEYGEIITQEEVLEFFRTKKTFDEWIKLSAKQINDLKYKGKSIQALVTIAWYNNPNKVNLYSKKWFQEFINWIFNKLFKEITKEEIMIFLRDKYNIDFLKNPTAKQISKIKYNWLWLVTFSKLCWWTNPNNINIYNPSWFQEFITWIFDKQPEKITEEKVLNFFRTEKTFDEWITLKSTEIRALKYKDKWIMNLAKLTWWGNYNNTDLKTPSWFQEFIAWVFGENTEN